MDRARSTFNAPPLREIIGPKTQIVELNEAIGRLALNTVNHEMCVPIGPKVLIFPQTAERDLAPIRVLQEPDTQMYALTFTIDPVQKLLIVAGDVIQVVRLAVHHNNADVGTGPPARQRPLAAWASL